MEGKSVTTSSTAWETIDVNVVSNYEDEIIIGKREYNELEECYTKNIKITLPGNELEELYRGLQHRYGDCNSSVCAYCSYEKDYE